MSKENLRKIRGKPRPKPAAPEPQPEVVGVPTLDTLDTKVGQEFNLRLPNGHYVQMVLTNVTMKSDPGRVDATFQDKHSYLSVSAPPGWVVHNVAPEPCLHTMQTFSGKCIACGAHVAVEDDTEW